MRRRFFTLDVFTTQRFAGNPLAVVLEPAGLDEAAMQAIAREYNLPETVFVFPPDDPKHRARLRIFTPARELPFAGHPTVGTAVLLAHLDGGNGQRDIILGEKVGPVVCTVQPSKGGGSARFGIPRMPEGKSAGDLPINYLKAAWPGIYPIARKYCDEPAHLPVVFGIALQSVLIQAKDVLDPTVAAGIAMETAIAMSKVDLGKA